MKPEIDFDNKDLAIIGLSLIGIVFGAVSLFMGVKITEAALILVPIITGITGLADGRKVKNEIATDRSEA